METLKQRCVALCRIESDASLLCKVLDRVRVAKNKEKKIKIALQGECEKL